MTTNTANNSGHIPSYMNVQYHLVSAMLLVCDLMQDLMIMNVHILLDALSLPCPLCASLHGALFHTGSCGFVDGTQ